VLLRTVGFFCLPVLAVFRSRRFHVISGKRLKAGVDSDCVLSGQNWLPWFFGFTCSTPAFVGIKEKAR
jgi:hypothetical protein